MTHSEVVDKKQSILPCCSHNCSYILNSDGIAVTTQITCVTFAVRHVHLHPILHGMNSMFRLMVDGNRMGIVTVTVEDNACKLRTASACLNWKLTW